MSKEEFLAFLSDLIDALTWKRALLIFLLGVSTILIAVVFENRTSLFNRFFDQVPVENISTPWEVSEQTKSEMIKMVKTPLVGAILLTEIDLKKNRKIVKFWYVEDEMLRNQALEISTNVLPQAFFDTDPKNNDQMLAVLNNQFLCSKTEDTIFIRFFPELSKTYPSVCRLAVPPFSGQFAGMITLFLTKLPEHTEVDSLKIEATQLSIETYLRDIQKDGRGRK